MLSFKKSEVCLDIFSASSLVGCCSSPPFQMNLTFLIFSLLLAVTVAVEVIDPPPITALVVPIIKDPPTNLHTVPLSDNLYFLDISSNYLSPLCTTDHATVGCDSVFCKDAHVFTASFCPATTVTADCQGNGKVCSTTISNTLAGSCFYGEVSFNDVVVSATDGRNPTGTVFLPNFTSVCGYNTMLGMMPDSVVGIAGVSRSPLALPSQFSSALSIKNQFAVCLSRSAEASGVMFFGSQPFYLGSTEEEDITERLTYTALLNNPRGSGAHYIGVKGMTIGQKTVEFDSGVFDFDAANSGGVMLSTAMPHTLMLTSIYNSFMNAYIKATEAANLTQVESRWPQFQLCINTTTLVTTPFGYDVPRVDMELTDGKRWTLHGPNLFAQMSPDVACLAFSDGGPMEQLLTYTAVILGAFQLEDNFLLFDLETSTVGYSSWLPATGTSCDKFEFQAQQWTTDLRGLAKFSF